MMRDRRLVRALGLLLLACCVVVGVAGSAAADPRVEREAQGIFHRIMSPYCPGLLLASCPSSLAEDLRNDIRADLEAGKAASAIEDDLHRRFGDATRAAPAFEGLGLVVWTVPLLLFIVSSVALLVWLRRCRGQAAGSFSSPAAAPASGPAGSGPIAASSGPLSTPPSHWHPISTPDSAGAPSPSSARAAEAALNERLDDELEAM